MGNYLFIDKMSNGLNLIPIFLSVSYALALFLASKYQKANKHKVAKNVLFVTAHPDDECMFFTPTIEEMKKKSNLFLLVLTNGGYDGLGKERTEEMAVAAKYMGFTNHKVLDDKRIPDGPR